MTDKVLIRRGSVPNWMVFIGCGYHTYPCSGDESTYCFKTYAMKRTTND